MRECYRLGLLKIVLPALYERIRGQIREGGETDFSGTLAEIDLESRGGRSVSTARLLVAVLGFAIDPRERHVKEVMRSLRDAALPLIPSNNHLRDAAVIILPEAEHPRHSSRGGRARRRRRRPRRSATKTTGEGSTA